MNNLVYVIPDTQVKPGVKNPLITVAHHICDLKPCKVIHMGDHWDFPSLSKYDKGKKSHRAKSYLKDIQAGNKAMEEFWEVIIKKWPTCKDSCDFVFLTGNHEMRRHRALEYGPDELIDLINAFPMDFNGWDKVLPFLKIYKFNGVNFSHYFQNLNSAYPIGSARQLCLKKHSSCIAAHIQGFDYAEMPAEVGKIIQCLIAGSCYFHDEEYKKHNNHHWRGSVVLTNVRDGMFDFARYELKTIEAYYGNKV